jgi:cation:H+ antiporter
VSESLSINIGLFVAAAVIIALVGTQMSQVSDRLADSTGLGEAVMGAVFLGGSTSLAGIVTSVTAAAGGHAELAVSNAIGGIAAQTAFLALADIFYTKANLEHAAASVTILVQGTLLITLLSIPLIGMSGPQVAIWEIHPATIVLFAAYLFGLRLIYSSQKNKMWSPRQTEETRQETKDETASENNLTQLWLKFALFAVIIAVSGYVIAQAGVFIAAQTGFSESVVGGLFTAISTSLPELVITIAAVRQGALALAVGGVIGGNCFDLLLLGFSDIAYRQGSIYNAIADRQIFVLALTILMTGILLLGLLEREKYGVGNIGFESFLILLIYGSGVVVLFL